MMASQILGSLWLFFMFHLGFTSPVYNMQPAFITTNIGSSGRNIRHLPCVSRKSGLQGTCMFAIDCLKANGTHLGTCIDRFYFGSCCHVVPSVADIDNVIDAALIPVRQPPYRLSSTTRKPQKPTEKPLQDNVVTNITTQQTGSTGSVGIISSVGSTASLGPVVGSTASVGPTIGSTASTGSISSSTGFSGSPGSTGFTASTGVPSSSSTLGMTRRPTESSTRPSSTRPSTTRLPTTLQQTTRESETTEKLTTVQFTSTTQRIFPPRRTTTPPSTTTEATKLQTFQSVESFDTTIKTTPKPSRGTQRPTTSKPTTTKPTTSRITTPTRPRPRPTSKPTQPTKTTPKSTTKPQRVTTRTTPKPYPTKQTQKPLKPTATITRVTTKPSVKPTKPPTKPTTPTTVDRIVTTQKVFTTTKIEPTTTPSKPSPLSTESTTTKTTFYPSTSIRLPETTQSQSNEIFPSTSRIPIVENVSGNPATNEIEPEKPVLAVEIPEIKPEIKPELKPELKPKPEVKPETTSEGTTQSPNLVTWAMINEGAANQTTLEPEDWVPITTPDGWVLLPSVSTITDQPPSATITQPPQIKINQTQSSSTTITSTVTDTTLINTTVTSAMTGETDKDTTMNDTMSVTVPLITQSPIVDARPTQKPINMTDFTDVCGRRMYPEGRIVGGEKSTFGRWPWQISLRQWKTSTYLHKCGAALLNENWAITAAHCVDNVPPSDLLLRLGEHDLSTDTEPHIHQERRVQIVASHPQFDPRTFEYDLALLRFYEPVTFQPNIVPVCVPQSDESFVGRTAYVTGWGRLYEDGPLPSVLQEVTVPVLENHICEAMYRNAGYIEHIPNIFICAGWRKGGYDSCEGDSGGPMVIQRKDKRFLLAGIISWGIGCAEPNQPGVYTRISEFRDWINQILQF